MVDPDSPDGRTAIEEEVVAGNGHAALPDPLTDAERGLIAAARAGDLARPALGPWPDPGRPAGWAGRTVRASVIAALCTARAGDVHHRGVRLEGALIEGALNMSFAELKVPLALQGCRVPEPMTLADVRAPDVAIRDCLLGGGLDAARIRSDGNLTLAGSTVHGAVDIYDARIDADLDCNAARLLGEDVALSAQGIEVGADVAFVAADVVAGAIDFTQAKIGRSVYLNGAAVGTVDGVASSLAGAEIRGDVFLTPARQLVEAAFRRAIVRGGLDLSGATAAGIDARGVLLEAPGRLALNLWGTRVARDIALEAWLDDGEGVRPQVEWRTQVDGNAMLSAATVGGDLVLSGAELTGSDPALLADRLRVEGKLSMDPVTLPSGELMVFTAEGTVSLQGARIGEIDARAAMLGKLDLWGATISRDLNLGVWYEHDDEGTVVARRAELDGVIELSAASIGRDLRLTGAQLRAPRFSLSGTGLSVGGTMLIDALTSGTRTRGGEPLRFETAGTVFLDASRLGALQANGARLDDPEGLALSLKGAHVAGDVSLAPVRDPHPSASSEVGLRCEVSGKLELGEVKIDGHLILSGARVEAEVVALNLVGAELARDLNAVVWRSQPESPPFRCHMTGTMQMNGARVDGSLLLSGAYLDAPEVGALIAESVNVGGSVELDRARLINAIVQDADGRPIRFEAEGRVTLQNATIGSVVTCRGGRFSVPGATALDLYGIKVGDDVLLEATADRFENPSRAPEGTENPIFEADGAVRLFSATVGKNLSLRGARVAHPRIAVSAGNLAVGGHLSLDGLYATGQVDLSRATAATLDCRNAKFRTAELEPAFDGSYFRTGGDVQWEPALCEGSVSFHGAAVGMLVDDCTTWPKGASEQRWIDLDGMVYDSLSQPGTWKERRDWLGGLAQQSTQPYRQLAAVYQKSGDERAARKINMERFNAGLRKGSPGRMNAWRWILRFGIGHGYEPWRAAIPLLVIWAVAWWIADDAVEANAMKPTRGGVDTNVSAGDCSRTDYPCLQPALYAADLVIPVVNLGQRERWAPTGATEYRLLPPLATLAGWILTTLVVAGFTGLVRRE